jgi:hypothetical protein
MKKITTAIFFAAIFIISANAQNPHKSLFDGRDLTRHWIMPGFRVSEGVIITDSPDGAGRNLFTRKQYGNFILRFEYFLSHLGNSGVFLRCDPGNMSTCVEVQLLAPWTPTRPDLYCTGSVYGHVPVTNRPDETPGIWHEMEIRYDRKLITVYVDGELTTTADTDTVESMKDRPLAGAIGFQSNHSGEGEYVKFRNIYIRDLDLEADYVIAGFYKEDDMVREQAHQAALSIGPRMIELLAGKMPEDNPMVHSGAKQVLFDIVAGATRPEASHSEKNTAAQALKTSIENCTSETTAEYLKWLLGMVESR